MCTDRRDTLSPFLLPFLFPPSSLAEGHSPLSGIWGGGRQDCLGSQVPEEGGRPQRHPQTILVVFLTGRSGGRVGGRGGGSRTPSSFEKGVRNPFTPFHTRLGGGVDLPLSRSCCPQWQHIPPPRPVVTGCTPVTSVPFDRSSVRSPRSIQQDNHPSRSMSIKTHAQPHRPSVVPAPGHGAPRGCGPHRGRLPSSPSLPSCLPRIQRE